MEVISGSTQEVEPVDNSLKKFHLGTIENAREYIPEHFNENISLHRLAQYCHVSLFHFSRIFKSVMNVSPHQYLAEIRLNHAKVLLTTTNEPVTDIAATTYRQQFKINPSRFRKEIVQAMKSG